MKTQERTREGKAKLNRKERREIEKGINPFKELMKVIKHFCPDLIQQLREVPDPRHQMYIDYEAELLLIVRILSAIMSVSSMRQITEKFNKDVCIKNISMILKDTTVDEIPHYDTINDYLEKLEAGELEKVRHALVYRLLRMKCFNNYRLKGYWPISIDGTCVYVFRERHCDHCLTKTYNKGTPEEKTVYFHYVLEAKLTIGDMVISIGSEFIENPENLIENPYGEFDKKKKQDCEIKAFYRFAQKLKKEYPHLPMCLLLDSLYANKEVFQICEANRWEYIIRFKEGSIPTVANEFKILVNYDKETTSIDKNTNDTYKYVNEIDYEGHKINVLEYMQDKNVVQTNKRKVQANAFVFITSPCLKITKKNQSEIASMGRNRWKIENHGFNEQKNHGYELEHPFSHNYTAMKNHYMLIQIAHMIRQLFENGIKMLKELKKALKDISYDLLEAFRNTVLTPLDMNDINKKRQIRLESRLC